MTTIIDLGKIRPTYKGAFDPAAAYEFNDVVRYGGYLYVYNYIVPEAGFVPTASADHWSKMMESTRFAGNYSAATAYKVGEVVLAGVTLYLCLADAPAATAVTNAAYFGIYLPGVAFNGVWAPAIVYPKGSIVTYGGSSFVALAAHTSSADFNADVASWTSIARGVRYRGAWVSGAVYLKDDLVTVSNSSYIAKTDITSANPPVVDVANWGILAPGISFQGVYVPATAYKKGDIVTYGPSSYIALQDTTGNLPSDAANWTLLTAGLRYRNAYIGATAYFKGDIVTYGGNSYIALVDVTGVLPPADAAKWASLAQGFSFAGAYVGATAYKVGQVVTYGASAFLCIADATGAQPDANPAAWAKLTSGQRFRGAWATGVTYVAGDIATYGAGAVIAAASHTASALFATDAANWSTLVRGIRNRGVWSSGAAYLKDDLVSFGTSSFIALNDVTSTTDPTGDGTNWQIAMVGSAGTIAKTGDTMTGPLGLAGVVEKNNIVAAAPTAVQTLDWLTAALQYHTVAATANFTLNLRGDAVNSLASKLAVGQSLTLAIMVTNGATGYWPNALQIDGVAITPRWQGGTTPPGGNVNAIDVYSFTITKTAATPTYMVLASQTKFV